MRRSFLTIYITLVVRPVDRQPGRAVHPAASTGPISYLPFAVPGFGLVVALVFITLLGFLTANYVGGRLVAFGEALARAHAASSATSTAG